MHPSKQIRTLLNVCLLSLIAWPSVANNNDWYWGNLSRVMTYKADGSFMVYSDNADVMAECAHDRVEFHVQALGAERVKLAHGMALTALASGMEFGLVMDLATSHTPGDPCKVSPTTSQGASVRCRCETKINDQVNAER